MKKFVAVLLGMVLVCSTAMADEILFRGIPWGSSIDEVFDEMGFINGDQVEDFSQIEDMSRLFYSFHSIDAFGSGILEGASWGGEAGLSFSPLTGCPKGISVGGHAVEWIKIDFIYHTENDKAFENESECEFIRGEYKLRPDNMPDAFEDLKGKLRYLYQEPSDSKVINNSYNNKREEYAVWYGDNNTGVVLYGKWDKRKPGETFQDEIRLFYGKTDTEEK